MRTTVILFCLSLVSGLAIAEEIRLPTSPLQTYYRAQRTAGAERSTALADALVQVAKTAEPQRRLEILQQASFADPSLAEPHLERTRVLLLQRRLGDALQAVGSAFEAVRFDVVESARWLRRLQRGTHQLLLGTLAVLALLLTLRSLVFVRHVLRVRFESGTALLVLAFAPILAACFFAPLIALLLPLFLLTPFLRRRERLALAILCATLGVADALLLRMQGDAILLDPTSNASRIARANFESDIPDLKEALHSKFPARHESELLLGMQARRRGDLASAQEHYMQSLTHDSTFAPAYVNLANIFFEMGDFERAVTGYRTAQSFEPENVHAHANLAQAYIRMIQYEESDHELHAASRLGYERIAKRRSGWSDHALPIADVPLPSQAVRRIAAAEAREHPQRAAANLESWRGPLWSDVPSFITPFLLLGLAALLLSPFSLHALVFECCLCSRVCCGHCTATREKITKPTCTSCAAAVIRVDATSRSRSRQTYTMSQGSGWLAPLFPGAADLTRGAPLVAFFTVLIACAAILVIFSDVATALSRSGTWYVGLDAGKTRFALLVFLLAYLPGLLRSRSRRRRSSPASLSNSMLGV